MMTWLRTTGLLWPTLLALPSLVILLALGTWQWQRMHWKQALLAQLEANSRAEAGIMTSWEPTPPSKEVIDKRRFLRVWFEGVYLHDHEFHVWAPSKSGPAWQVITPVKFVGPHISTSGRLPLDFVFVIRGTVPEKHKSAASRAIGRVTGPQRIVGRLRASAPNWSAPSPNISKNQWYARDLGVFADHFAKTKGGDIKLAQMFVEVEKPTGPPPAPQPRLGALTLSNRHFEYAFTWWGLAATLIGVYLAFAISRLRNVTNNQEAE